MPYEPRLRSQREELAKALQTVLTRSGFTPTDIPGTYEEVWERMHHRDNRIVIRVYTTIEGGFARNVGSDAIRVVPFYVAGGKAMSRGPRINRVGTIEAICERLLARMRDTYGKALQGNCTSCGAPLMMSKKAKKLYCADVCWVDQ
jgi:hypothetical protein